MVPSLPCLILHEETNLNPDSRDDSQKLRTNVAAKAALYSSLSDELRRVIGGECYIPLLFMLHLNRKRDQQGGSGYAV